jgi:hypothetical protein
MYMNRYNQRVSRIIRKLNNDELSISNKHKYYNSMYYNINNNSNKGFDFMLIDDYSNDSDINDINSFNWNVDKLYLFLMSIRDGKLRKELFLRLIHQPPNIITYCYFTDLMIIKIHFNMFIQMCSNISDDKLDDYVEYHNYFRCIY